MLFVFKKVISAFMMPMTALFMVIFCGLFLLWFSKKRERLGKIFVTAGSLLLLAVCLSPLSDSLMWNLEREYPAFNKTDTAAKYIWVLGSGSVSDTTVPIFSRLSSDGLHRVAEGVRIYNMLEGCKLVFSGYGGGDAKATAEVAAEAARGFGVPQKDIIIVPEPRDTREEAIKAAEIVSEKPFILVTSASHMKRSMRLFEKEGLAPIPAPCGQYIKYGRAINFRYFLPSPYPAVVMQRYVHERLGLIWAKIRR